jgi:cysteinyl-tRNA synthetase
MTRQRIPDDILSAAHARAAARAARHWAEADRLRAEIEAAGWRIVDRGTDFALSPAAPLDVPEGGRTRYGASANVPSRLEDTPIGVATIVLVATGWPEDLSRALSGLAEHAPEGTSIVVVADGPSPEQEAALDVLEAGGGTGGLTTEVVWTSERLGHAAAINAGARRAEGPVVTLLDTSVEPVGDFVTPLAAALDDASVAVAGGWGIVSGDLRHFEEAPPGNVDAIEGYALAFRRSDFAERGPLDEHFRFYRNLDIWWSLMLRDEGEGRAPRRAVTLADLPLAKHEHRGYTSLPPEERDRQSKRNFYRIIDRFGSRRDLLIHPDG